MLTSAPRGEHLIDAHLNECLEYDKLLSGGLACGNHIGSEQKDKFNFACPLRHWCFHMETFLRCIQKSLTAAVMK